MPVILHIGMQKTGTTALQYFFHTNRERLARDGLAYPHIGQFEDIPFSGVSYHNSIAGTLGRIRSAFPPMTEEGLRTLKKFLQTSSERVILSAEDFSRSLDLTDIQSFFSDVPTKVVVYLREQSAWAESMYNQRNKLLFTRAHERLLSEDILAPANLFDFLRVEQYGQLLHYDTLLQRWTDAFGRANMIVRTFPPKEVASDFLEAIGITDMEGYNLPPRVNDNLSNEWLLLVRELAEKIGQEHALEVVRALTQAMNERRINLTGATRFLPEQIVKKMRSDYAERNSLVAREFFNRDELFRPYVAKAPSL